MEKEIVISILTAVSWIFGSLIVVVTFQKMALSISKWNRRRKRSISTRKRYEDFIIGKKISALNQLL